MNLELTSKEMEILLSLTANNSFKSDNHDSLWRKVSAGFTKEWDSVKDRESLTA